MSTMGRPKEHNDATRTALLLAAEQLVESQGPDAVSVRAVAEVVGTTTRAVYSVFGSKDALLEALATRLFEMLGEAVDAVPLTEDPAADVIDASLGGFRRIALEHPSLYGLVFLRVVPDLRLGPAFEQVAAGAFDRFESLIGRLEATGQLGSASASDAAHAIHALTEGLATMELRGAISAATGAERIWREALTALLHGFAVGDVAPVKARTPARSAGA
jgi:AcrR family transcriptional regulator